MPAHLHASVCQFHPDRAGGGHTNVKGKAADQRLRPVACVQHEVEEGEEVNYGEATVPALAAVATAPIAIAPKLVVNSNFKATEHIFPSVFPVVGDEVKRSFVGGGGAESSSEVDMAPKPKNLGTAIAPKKSTVVVPPPVQDLIQAPLLVLLAPTSAEPSLPFSRSSENEKGRHPRWVFPNWLKRERKTGSIGTLTPIDAPKFCNLKFFVAELERQVTTSDTSKDHDTCLALAQAVMLLNDVANLVAEGSVEAGDLMVMQYVQKLAKLQKVAHCLVYERVFDHGYNWAGYNWARDNCMRQAAELRPEGEAENEARGPRALRQQPSSGSKQR
ncbi:hypothetical protein Acr_00g0100470 [Actinidia rufa]|uniref:Uncharacterized protein n=1 Tax=Actinidia rufa TaxID=165716 RepID=A0A7J0E0H4_9ERIC|nr:hypothetical protein Acr_00g0100470 [Actinidia rufa]